MAQPLEKTEQLYSQAVTLIGGTTATYGGDGITGVVSAEETDTSSPAFHTMKILC